MVSGFFYFCQMEKTHTAWIGMGSNQGNRLELLQMAIDRLANGEIVPIAISRVYETAPVGFESEDHFLNAVVQINCRHTPLQLLSELQSVEKELGRVRSSTLRYTSRTIDLDILFFDQEVINNPKLRIPHPEIAVRRFVLDPLNDLIPSYKHPILEITVTEILEKCIDKNRSLIHPKPLSINH
jgi:2-amino-4-hydroxy-6-hydroxymethyldihydropteridine diphosphokinase